MSDGDRPEERCRNAAVQATNKSTMWHEVALVRTDFSMTACEFVHGMFDE